MIVATKMTVPDNCGSKRRRVLDKKEDCFEDNCGSTRRRIQEKRGDCIEKTKRKAGENTMMERLEGDEAIE
jgi:hypothetical protein